MAQLGAVAARRCCENSANGWNAPLRTGRKSNGQLGGFMTAIREVSETDAPECGRIIYEAFASIAAEHNFLADFPSVEIATGLASNVDRPSRRVRGGGRGQWT